MPEFDENSINRATDGRFARKIQSNDEISLNHTSVSTPAPTAVALSIEPDSKNPDEVVVVTDANGRRRRIHIEEADPEHRFAEYRLAAGWFANMPAGYPSD